MSVAVLGDGCRGRGSVGPLALNAATHSFLATCRRSGRQCGIGSPQRTEDNDERATILEEEGQGAASAFQTPRQPRRPRVEDVVA